MSSLCCAIRVTRLVQTFISSSATFCHIMDVCCEANIQQLWSRVFCSCRSEAVEQPSTVAADLRQANISFQRFKRLLKTFLFGCWDHGALWLTVKLRLISFLTYLLVCVVGQCQGGCDVLGVMRRSVHCVWSANKHPAGTACDTIPRPVRYKPCRSTAQQCRLQPGQLFASPSAYQQLTMDLGLVQQFKSTSTI